MIVASYNVHGCVGTDGAYDPERITAVLAELDADAVGLQEVDTSRTLQGDASWLDRAAAALGLQVVVGPTVGRGGGFYGNALLTRRPLTRVRLHDLSVRRREPRGAVDVELEAQGGERVRLVVTHFGLKRWERRAQVDRLVRVLADGDGAELLVVAGDLNEWWPVSPVLHRLHAAVARGPRVRSWPSQRPLLALDRILVRPARRLSAFAVHASQLARTASDHLPVRAVIAP